MNKYKEAYKEEIVSDIVDKYVKLDITTSRSQNNGTISDIVLNQKLSTLRYMRNLIKTIAAEGEEEIDQRIEEGRDRYCDEDEEEE